MYSITISVIDSHNAYVDSLFPSETVVECDDAGVVTLTLQLDFMLNVLVVVLTTNLYRDWLSRQSLRCFIHRTVASCPQTLIETNVREGGIFILEMNLVAGRI